MVDLSGVLQFERGKNKKYRAILKNGRTVEFGAKGYQHYKDQVPKSLGGGLYTAYDHLDEKRRQLYRIRHRAIIARGQPAHKKKYSPAWFSWHLLW